MVKIHHLGIVTPDIDEALLTLGLTRADITESVYDANQKNTLHFIFLKENNLWLEFVEPMDATSSVANFARKNGLGLHHLAMGSTDLAATEEKYKQQEGTFVLGRYAINVKSFGGNIKTLFVAVKGLILEFVQNE